jgi:signal transduction histidine kinase
LPILDETIMLLKNSRDYIRNIRISMDIHPTIQLKGDTQRLRQVFWNLFLNACQAMPNGGDITCTAVPFSQVASDTMWCEIVIADTGEGIAREDLDKIFDPFYTTKTGGSGLGLAIAYRIVEDHGGVIGVSSEPGKGTQFRIRLPMVEESAYPISNGSALRDLSQKAVQ